MKAESRSEETRRRILETITATIGYTKANEIVIGKLRDWFAKTGRATLAKLPADERGGSKLMNSLAALLCSEVGYCWIHIVECA